MSFVEETHREFHNLDDIAARLFRLSSALHNCGMNQLSDTVFGCAQDIAESRLNLEKAVSDRIDKNFQEARQNSANMLNAALAAIKLKEGKK